MSPPPLQDQWRCCAETGCWRVPFPAPTLPLNPNADAFIPEVQKTQLEDVELAQVDDLAAEPFSKPQTDWLAEKLGDTVTNDNLETGDGDDLELSQHVLDALENVGLKQGQAAEPALKKPFCRRNGSRSQRRAR